MLHPVPMPGSEQMQPDGARAWTQLETQPTWYVNDLTAEHTQTLQTIAFGEVQTTYTYGVQRLYAQSENETQTYLYDGRGSVSQQVVGGNTVANNFAYSPWGEVLQGAEEYAPFYGYNGEEHHPETGLQFLRARHYAPSMAAFTTQDTYGGVLEDPASLNRYAYAGGNPVNDTVRQHGKPRVRNARCPHDGGHQPLYNAEQRHHQLKAVGDNGLCQRKAYEDFHGVFRLFQFREVPLQNTIMGLLTLHEILSIIWCKEMIAMANENVTIRMDDGLRRQADSLFEQMGLNMTTAVNAFVRQAVREGKIPFELKGDERAFWDKAEEKAWAAIKRAQSPDAQWFSTDEVFGEVDTMFAELDAGGIQ